MGKCLAVTFFALALAAPAHALDLNSYRAQNGKRPLSHSVRLAGIAYEQAAIMAGRGRIGHENFVGRIGGMEIGRAHV